MSPELQLQAAMIGFAVVVIGAFGSWITTTIELRKIKVQQEQIRMDAQKTETERDNKRDDIFNTFVVDWNQRLEDQQKKLDTYTEKVIELRERNSRLQGQIEAITDNHNNERDSWRRQRQELLDKIDKLEKRIVELEHEKQAKIERIEQLVSERDALKKQLQDRNNLVLDLTGKNSELELSLMNCHQEKDEVRKKTAELKSKVTELEQPETEEEQKGSKAS